jgi:hypothetical protein
LTNIQIGIPRLPVRRALSHLACLSWPLSGLTNSTHGMCPFDSFTEEKPKRWTVLTGRQKKTRGGQSVELTVKFAQILGAVIARYTWNLQQLPKSPAKLLYARLPGKHIPRGLVKLVGQEICRLERGISPDGRAVLDGILL